jgi:hypothetical protein
MKPAFKFFSVLLLALACSALGQVKPADKPQAEPGQQEPPRKSLPRRAAGEKPATPEDPASRDVTSATVERIMEQAVRNIAATYNLSPEQVEMTDKLMKTRVRAFLKEHESEVWPLIRELLTTQMGNKPPEDIEQVKRIGKAAKPLAKLAQEAILEGNQEWRKHLTPEQKTLHDFDLKEMEDTFKTINQRFDAWAEGNPPPGGLFPQPTPSAERPQRPGRPAPGPLPEARTEVVAVRESFFDTFVNQFILENQLDPGQVTAAKSILNEFKAKAQDFKNAHKEELAGIAVAQQTAKDAKDQEKLAEVDEARKQLLQPVYQLFGEMEERLTPLLTSVQLAKYKERQPATDLGKRQEAIDREVLPALEKTPPAKTAKDAPPKKETESN